MIGTIMQRRHEVPMLEPVIEEELHDVRHREQGDAAAEVAPAAGGRVDLADDRAVEELRAPDLAGDEGREREADDDAAEQEQGVALREGEQDHARDADEEQEDKGHARAELVAEGAGEDAHEDGAGDGEVARELELRALSSARPPSSSGRL